MGIIGTFLLEIFFYNFIYLIITCICVRSVGWSYSAWWSTVRTSILFHIKPLFHYPSLGQPSNNLGSLERRVSFGYTI